MGGTIATGLVLSVTTLAGPVAGLISGFFFIVLTIFVFAKIDEARGL